jgi:hypothetical protein
MTARAPHLAEVAPLASALPFPRLVAPLSPALVNSDAAPAVQDRPATYSELTAIPLSCGRPLFRLSFNRAGASALARPYSRILAQPEFDALFLPAHRIAPALGGASLNLPGALKGVRSFWGKPGSVGALAGLILNSNPYKTILAALASGSKLPGMFSWTL